MLAFLNNISPIEIAVIAIILIVLFGSRVVTRLGRTSGETLKEIKNIKKTFTEALEDKDEPAKKASSK